MTIRAATLGDEQRSAVLNGFVQSLHTAYRPDHFKASTLAEVANWFRAFLQNASARTWIAEEEGTAVGYILAIVQERPESSLCHAWRWCEIDQIAVDPSLRRKAIASALMRKAVLSAAADGIVEVELCTCAFNEQAQVTFRRLGFVPKILLWELRSGSR